MFEFAMAHPYLTFVMVCLALIVIADAIESVAIGSQGKKGETNSE